MKTNKFTVLRFWVEYDINILCRIGLSLTFLINFSVVLLKKVDKLITNVDEFEAIVLVQINHETDTSRHGGECNPGEHGGSCKST